MAERVPKEITLKVLDTLNESQARWSVAMQAMMLGHGGIKEIYELTGLSRPTTIKGIKELKTKEKLADGERIRCSGGGPKRIEERNPEISKILNQIMNETTAGDPMSLLKWTSKSIYQIRNQIQNSGYSIGKGTVHGRLKEMAYSLQANVKVREGETYKDRDSSQYDQYDYNKIRFKNKDIFR